jgi:hypothetical protein
LTLYAVVRFYENSPFYLRELKLTGACADLLYMSSAALPPRRAFDRRNPVAKICDPDLYSLNDALQQARTSLQGLPHFELDLVRVLQAQCLANVMNLLCIFRGLEIMGGILDETPLVTLLRPFLRPHEPRIASKCILILGRQSQSFKWLTAVMSESDDRVRANLIESLWGRTEPEVESVLRNAVADSHHRVVANAVYGLYLLKSESYAVEIDSLLVNKNASFRRAAVWVLKTTGEPGATVRLKPLISDRDAHVRRSVFDALIFLRQRAAKETLAAVTAVDTPTTKAGNAEPSR